MKLFPAVQGQVGNWKYYATKMTAGELSESVRFAHELDQPAVLDRIIQRELRQARALNDIARYLVENQDHFFNSLVIAAWDGNPTFFDVTLADDPRFAMIADKRFQEAFGVLRFDGTQKYYALDGQHRLRAIKALLTPDETEFRPAPEFQREEFPVIVVLPKRGESFADFLPRYRRLFSSLNRYAKPMDLATVIAMDEDDTFAILTRRLISEHEFFRWYKDDKSSRIRVTGGKSVPDTENCFMSLITLYEMNTDLLWSSKRSAEFGRVTDFVKQSRRSDSLLNDMFTELRQIWDTILAEFPIFGNTPTHYRSSSGHDFTREDGQAITNHLLFRPIGQDLLARTVRRLLDANPQLPQRDAIHGLSRVEWRLHHGPWRHLLSVYDSDHDRWKMRTEKSAQDVGANILYFITNIQSHDEGTLETLRQTWIDQLQNPDPDYIEQAWSSVRKMARDFQVAQS